MDDAQRPSPGSLLRLALAGELLLVVLAVGWARYRGSSAEPGRRSLAP